MNQSIRTIICLLIMLLAFIPFQAEGQEAYLKESAIRKLETKIEIIEKKHYITEAVSYSVPSPKSKSISKHREKVAELAIGLKLSVRNLDSQPIIIDGNFTTVRRIVSEKGKDNQEDKLISGVTYYIAPAFITLDPAAPPGPRFVILKPDEIYTTNLNDVIRFDIESSRKLMNGVLLKYVFLTWGGTGELGKTMRDKWSKFGYLYLDAVTTDSVLVKVEQCK